MYMCICIYMIHMYTYYIYIYDYMYIYIWLCIYIYMVNFIIYIYIYVWLVVWNMTFIFPIISGMSSSHLTFTCFRGGWKHQPDVYTWCFFSYAMMILYLSCMGMSSESRSEWPVPTEIRYHIYNGCRFISPYLLLKPELTSFHQMFVLVYLITSIFIFVKSH